MNPCHFRTNLHFCVTFFQTSQRNENNWAPELSALGYDDTLPAPSPAVQATMVGLNAPEIHEYIQTQDRQALLDLDEDGMHAPLFLLTLDLSQWTLVLAAKFSKAVAGLEQLKVAHAQLADILDFEAEEIEIATHNIALVDVALKKANPHEIPKQQTISLATGEIYRLTHIHCLANSWLHKPTRLP